MDRSSVKLFVGWRFAEPSGSGHRRVQRAGGGSGADDARVGSVRRRGGVVSGAVPGQRQGMLGGKPLGACRGLHLFLAVAGASFHIASQEAKADVANVSLPVPSQRALRSSVSHATLRRDARVCLRALQVLQRHSKGVSCSECEHAHAGLFSPTVDGALGRCGGTSRVRGPSSALTVAARAGRARELPAPFFGGDDVRAPQPSPAVHPRRLSVRVQVAAAASVNDAAVLASPSPSLWPSLLGSTARLSTQAA